MSTAGVNACEVPILAGIFMLTITLRDAVLTKLRRALFLRLALVFSAVSPRLWLRQVKSAKLGYRVGSGPVGC